MKKKIIVFFDKIEDIKSNEFLKLYSILHECCEFICYVENKDNFNEQPIYCIDTTGKILFFETKDAFIKLNAEVWGRFYVTSGNLADRKFIKPSLYCSIVVNSPGFYIDPEDDLNIIVIIIFDEFVLCDMYPEDYYFLENDMFHIKQLTGHYREFDQSTNILKQKY